MIARTDIAVATLLALTVVPIECLGTDGLPLKITRLSDRVVLVGAMTGNSTTVGLASEKGLVMIDALWSPSIAGQAREMIAKEFGRDDFTHLILTSDDILQTGGTEAFSDVRIIAQERCRESLEKRRDSLEQLLERRGQEFRGRVERTEAELAEGDPASAEAEFDRQWLELCQRIADDLAEGYEITLPHQTFQDRMTLDLGDMTVNLIYFGRASNEGDVVVHVPEVGLAMLGDIFHFGHMLPRCRECDVDRWVEILDNLVQKNRQVVHVVRSNSPGPWTQERLVSHRNFIRDISKKVKAAADDGLGLDEAVDRVSTIENEFPYVLEWDEYSDKWDSVIRGDIRALVSAIWRQSHESAATIFARVLDESSVDAARAKLQDIRADPSNEAYFLEGEFNSLGYRLLGQERIDDAIAVFRMVVDMYPESWNAYDSLGEGYMLAGESKLAIENYRKSLELNPDNTNGGDMLEQLESRQ